MSALARARTAGAMHGRTVLLLRAGLALVGVAQAEVGLWGLIAPRSFFGNFPGAGHHWVAALGPYNEHLVRDYAAGELGLAVLLIFAAVFFRRRLLLIAGTTFLFATLPHFAYHLTTTGSYSTADNVGSLASFALELGIVSLAMAAAARMPERSR